MTTLFMDSFDFYGAGRPGLFAMLQGPYADIQSLPGAEQGIAVPSYGARTGAFALQNYGLGTFRRVLPAATSKITAGFGFACDTLPTSNSKNGIFSWRDAANTVIAALYLSTTGAIEIRGKDLNLISSTQGPVIVTSAWQYVECQLDTAAETLAVHVNDADGTGAPVLQITGGTFTGLIAQVGLLDVNGGLGTAQCWMDDLIVRDSAGTANNGFAGDLRIATLFPVKDDLTYHGWTPRYEKKFGAGVLDNRPVASFVTAAGTASTDISGADFTIEGFFRFAALPLNANKAVLLGKWDETTNPAARCWQLYLGGPTLNNASLAFRYSTDGTDGTAIEKVAYPFAPELNRWYHIACVRAAGELLLFVDGAQLGLPVADTAIYFASTLPELVICGQDSNHGAVAGTSASCMVDELRLTIGVGRYTGSFTPGGPWGRNVTSDPDFPHVALLCGFDNAVADESSYGRALTAQNGSGRLIPDDGPLIGAFSAIDQSAPRDDTFVEAPFLPAKGVLTLAGLPAPGDTITLGTTNGTTAAVYTWRATVAAAYDVLIGAAAADTALNFIAAVNAGAGPGTAYGAGTLANNDVLASALPNGQVLATALRPGAAGNAIVSTETGAATSWSGATLTGGSDIPGPSQFGLGRPPTNTTLIKAVQTVARAYKSDAGVCTIKTSFVGGLGAVVDGAAHTLTVAPNYYEDIFEADPDTGNPITPSTVVSSKIRFTRTA